MRWTSGAVEGREQPSFLAEDDGPPVFGRGVAPIGPLEDRRSARRRLRSGAGEIDQDGGPKGQYADDRQSLHDSSLSASARLPARIWVRLLAGIARFAETPQDRDAWPRGARWTAKTMPEWPGLTAAGRLSHKTSCRFDLGV